MELVLENRKKPKSRAYPLRGCASVCSNERRTNAQSHRPLPEAVSCR